MKCSYREIKPMRRTTQAELDRLARMISRKLGQTYTIEYAYGRPRLHTNEGSKEVSPRLPKDELRQWMEAFIQGIGEGFRVKAHQFEGESCSEGGPRRGRY